MDVVWVSQLLLVFLVGQVVSNPCGDALTGSSGFLTSENFPNNFPKNSDCAWNITVPVGHIIRLTFLNFTLEPNEETDCSDSLGGARVFITNVASDDGAQEFKLCGQNIPNPVYSVGNFVQVRLLSLNNVFSGFNLTYEAISRQDVCPTLAQLNETSGIITSPFYPRRYPNHQNYNWQITANNGNRIKLEIADTMDVFECGSERCVCDYLEIQNGYSSDGAASGEKCGKPKKILTYYSTLDTLKLNFFSDGTNEMQSVGFKATYTQLNFMPPVCPNEAIPLTGNGTLSSPNYPKDDYLPSSSCTWAITVSADKRIKFAFTNFSLGSCSLECSSQTCTSVEVYDGPSTSSALLARFCHDSAEEERVSSGNQMFVKFYGGFKRAPGFEAQYSETTDAPSPTAAKPKTTAPETTVPTTTVPTTTAKAPTICPAEAIPLTGDGKISSANYPMSNYPASRDCSWIISGPSDKLVKLRFTYFALGSCQFDCNSGNCTYVELYDGPFANSSSLGRFCSGSTLREVLSNGNQMLVNFRSSSSVDRGFEAQYSLIASKRALGTTAPCTGAVVSAALLPVTLAIFAASIFWL